MNIKNSYAYSFSPAGTTETVLKALSKNLPNNEFQSITTKSVTKEFTNEDLIVVGVPAFGGRVPHIALKNIKHLKGNNTPAIAVVVYGNREYDDALLELVQTLRRQGFKVVSAAAFTSRHSIVTEIAKTRPNSDDLAKAEKFAQESLNKLSAIDNIENIDDIKVKGNFPYVKYNGLPVKSKTSSLCNKCGKCSAECPAQAIPKEAPHRTDKKLCITCMRCINICPQKARDINKFFKKIAGIALKKSTSQEKHPEFFI